LTVERCSTTSNPQELTGAFGGSAGALVWRDLGAVFIGPALAGPFSFPLLGQKRRHVYQRIFIYTRALELLVDHTLLQLILSHSLDLDSIHQDIVPVIDAEELEGGSASRSEGSSGHSLTDCLPLGS
jgi:hypothetical protein